MAEMLKVEIKRLPGAKDLPLPKYMTPGAAGMDLYAAVKGKIQVQPGEIVLVPTGVSIALPPGYEGQVRPRSGLALKHGITLLNSPGTIDADYRGEIKVILINNGPKAFIVRRGDRIAQLVVNKVARVQWQEVDNLKETLRNNGSFGHTG